MAFFVYGTMKYKSTPCPATILRFPRKDLRCGFDCISNDYKVVRIVGGYNYIDKQVIKVQLYSTNDASWRQIQFPDTIKTSLFCLHFGSERGCQVKGVLYSQLNENEDVVSFDLHNEVFGLVSVPKLKPTEKKSKLFDFEGSLAFMSTSTIVGDGRGTSIWTLDDVCGTVSWTKKFNFEHGLWIDCEFVYLSAGKFVVYDSERLILYDYKKKTSKELQRSSMRYGAAVKYTKSLVSFEGFKPYCKLLS